MPSQYFDHFMPRCRGAQGLLLQSFFVLLIYSEIVGRI